MTSKLTLIYVSLCAFLGAAALSVQASHGESETSMTGLSEEGLRAVITAIAAE